MGVSIQHSFEIPNLTKVRNPRTILQSWKEIASELDRGVRTVQRWEQSLGLPIHRLGKGARCPVFAFQDELHLWFRNKARLSTVRSGGIDEEREPRAPGRSVAIPGQNTSAVRRRAFSKSGALSELEPKSQARILQSISDLFAREGSRHKPHQCKECKSPMRFFEGCFSLYGTDIKWSIPIPYCPDCDQQMLKLLQPSTIH